MQRIKDLLAAPTPRTWLFYGASITQGTTHTFGERDYTELFSERIRNELGRPTDIIVNTAISGNNTNNLLEEFDWRAGRFKPDVVFLMIGMNDCSANCTAVSQESFGSNLRELCDRFKAIGTLMALQTTCPILPGTSPDREPHFDAYMDIIREIAAERELPLFDHTAFWQKNKKSHYYWMSNEFHPNNFGHRAFAKYIFKQLGIWKPHTSTTCKLITP